jgi:Chalcone isomerase-like
MRILMNFFMRIFTQFGNFLLLCALALQLGSAVAKNSTGLAKFPQEIDISLPNAQFSGTGKLTYFGLNVYEANLWVSSGFKANDFEDHAFALDLHYLRNFSAADIAKRSLDEMQRIEPVSEKKAALWLKELTGVIPNVKKGDRLIGVHKPGAGVTFWLNGKRTGEIKDAEFSKHFFAIWLSPKTSEPKMRMALLGYGN